MVAGSSSCRSAHDEAFSGRLLKNAGGPEASVSLLHYYILFEQDRRYLCCLIDGVALRSYREGS